MYLTSIEIHGFKSFANKTVLHFLPPKNDKYSITAIVGPNGSGKSNISDAIRWVFGEQSMKQLRGKKSADIIFAGSEGKGQMSMASVTLTLDNRDKQVAIEYDELVITRRLYRSGESEYVLNGNTIRLLDLQIILAKAQFGHGSYSVIGQGTIDRMLLQSAEERKAFFDEASGIKEFQIKRHQSYLKLRRSVEHMDQADLLLAEITPRLKTLSRQVKKLEERQTVESELRGLQEAYYSSLLTHHESQLATQTEELKLVNGQFGELQTKLTRIQEDLASLAREASRQDAFAELQRAYQAIVEKKNNLERERAILVGRLQTEYSRAGKQNVSWLEQKVGELIQQQKRVHEEMGELTTEEQSEETQVNNHRTEVQNLEIERTQLRGKMVQLEQRASQAKSDQTLWQYSGLKAVEAILSERHRFGDVHGAVAQLGTVENKFQLALDIAAGSHLSSLVVGDDRVAESCIQYLREYQLGYATFLPLNKIRERIIPQNLEQYLGRSGVHGFALDLIRFDKKFSSIFSYIFGSTLIIDDVSVARDIGIGRVRMVTLDGDVIDTSGSMRGGYRRKKQDGLSFSEHALYSGSGDAAKIEEEMKLLQQNMSSLEIAHVQAQEAYREAVSKKEILRTKHELLEHKKHELDREIASLEQELSLHTMSPGDYGKVMEEVTVQKQSVEDSISAIEEELQVAQERITAFNDEEEKKKQRVFALQDEMQEVQQALNAIGERKNTIQVDIAKLETKLEDLDHEMYQEIRLSRAQLREQLGDMLPVAQLEDIQVKIQKLKYTLSLIGGIDEEVVKEYEETKIRHDELAAQLDDLKKTAADLETLIAELDEVMRKRRNKAFKQIRREFSRYFAILFEGGEADLIELYGEEKPEGEEVEDGEVEHVSDEVDAKLNRGKKVLTGIDVKACPPGKRIKNLQALSGGERTMTSIALVCAILHTNPSPFVVLDEVEAALDEANTIRFTNILHELSFRSQFILITHNRTTMHSADALYGVTMGNDGISQLLSVKLGEAEKELLETA